MNNLISNDCMGSILYRKHFNRKYLNPFANNLISFDHFLYLCKNIQQLKLEKARIITQPSDVIVNFTRMDTTYGIYIDNAVYIWYPHNTKDAKTVFGRYMTRLNRMNETMFNDNVFILDQRGFNPMFKIEDEDIQKFIDTEMPGKKLIITGNPDFKKFENDRLKVFVKNSSDVDNNAELIYLNYKDYLTT